mmetsp:Transcript_10471/g.31565  ORF Transcript_10471/g.31565 Transcript_10471/m.31565 type:complete len:372 (-) Transcript_10471:1308-2423(-)
MPRGQLAHHGPRLLRDEAHCRRVCHGSGGGGRRSGRRRGDRRPAAVADAGARRDGRRRAAATAGAALPAGVSLAGSPPELVAHDGEDPADGERPDRGVPARRAREGARNGAREALGQVLLRGDGRERAARDLRRALRVPGEVEGRRDAQRPAPGIYPGVEGPVTRRARLRPPPHEGARLRRRQRIAGTQRRALRLLRVLIVEQEHEVRRLAPLPRREEEYGDARRRRLPGAGRLLAVELVGHAPRVPFPRHHRRSVRPHARAHRARPAGARRPGQVSQGPIHERGVWAQQEHLDRDRVETQPEAAVHAVPNAQAPPTRRVCGRPRRGQAHEVVLGLGCALRVVSLEPEVVEVLRRDDGCERRGLAPLRAPL